MQVIVELNTTAALSAEDEGLQELLSSLVTEWTEHWQVYRVVQ